MKDKLVSKIADITYLYKSGRLPNTHFFDQSKTDLEHMLCLLKEYGYKDKDYSNWYELDEVIEQLDESGYLPVKEVNFSDYLNINRKQLWQDQYIQNLQSGL